MSTSIDFFISYTQTDRRWAEWIAWRLKEVGYTVFLQAWDIAPGKDWVHEMHRVSSNASHILAVLSPNYLDESTFGEAEWRVAFADDPSGERRRLIPVRVADCRPGGLLGTRAYIDLVGRNESDATNALLVGVLEQGFRPREKPTFPGVSPASLTPEPRFPGAYSVSTDSTELPWSLSTVGKPKSDHWTALLRLTNQQHVVEYSSGSIDRISIDGSVFWKSVLPRAVKAESIITDGPALRTMRVQSNYRHTSWDIDVDGRRIRTFRAS